MATVVVVVVNDDASLNASLTVQYESMEKK